MELSGPELQILTEMDSRQFGFPNPLPDKTKELLVKAIAHLERMIIEARTEKKITIEAKTYCKLGHFNLLLLDFPKAKSAYEKYYKEVKDAYIKDSPFMYGLGLVYFNFGALSWAIKLFQLILYVDPLFSRKKEVHIRLGIIFKVKEELESSLQHFRLALNDSSPGSLSDKELKFHIAHLYDVLGKGKSAKLLYEQLLQTGDLTPQLRADTYRQLGWLYHTDDSLGDKSQREPVAIHCLQKSIESEPRSGHTLYLLGRCFASIGKVHDAFLAYRNSVDKSEGNADTWCSIGVLYQQQSQPLDALQAYICAVQLDKYHVAGWTNLGILYESVSQPKDAFACFVNASRGKGSMSANLKERIKFLSKSLASTPKQEGMGKHRQLPVIEEAWNLPISADMAARAQNFKQEALQGMKKFKVESVEKINDDLPINAKNPNTPLSPPFSPNFSDQELSAWLGEKNLGVEDDLNFDSFDDFEFNNNFDPSTGNSLHHHHQNQHHDVNGPPRININMSSDNIVMAAKLIGVRNVSNCSILAEGSPPPGVPDLPKPSLLPEQLLPQTPSVLVENRKDAFSIQLQEYCLQHPIAVVRGIAAALKLDLGLFSTKTLVETNPEHSIEVRHQYQQPSDMNYRKGLRSWDCYSRPERSTIINYAQYQASSFKESVSEENQRLEKQSDSDSKDSTSRKKLKKNDKAIKFGTNVDLSDGRKWKAQLEELQKLPAFARVVSPANMLTHVGHVILGMNTVQLYMKVPGSRTPGHQENNNFCSININIGPGECEWFGVPDAYWGGIQSLCERNKQDYLKGSWWPNLDDLYREKIPVYRFVQKPGDLVWVNSGCVHWVQAIGWCNNIAWNVGPLTSRQYQLALERYEWNKLHQFKSIVPMIHLSWNLARNIHLQDQKMFELIKTVLMKTLVQTVRVLELVRLKNLRKSVHERRKDDPSHYCNLCNLEVFNLLFVKEQEKRHVVHCLDCARSASQDLDGFICLEEYPLQELKDDYDNFVLHNSTTTSAYPSNIIDH